jgi:hypothetical protein
MSDQNTEHPHRCREGHRWQHMGPTAAVCKIAVDDSYTGDLSLVSAPDCPLCSRREDLLKRDLHTHYCNVCEGSWDHEGRCVEGVVAGCPWCFRIPSAPPAPGARRGAHFHFCPECTQNWQHDTSCSAPLRVELPDCSGCRELVVELVVEPSTGERAVRATMNRSPFRVHASPIDVVRAARHFIRPAVVPVSIVVGVILAVPLAINVSSTLWSLAPTTSRDISTPTKGTRLRDANTPANATARPSPSAPARSNQVASAPSPEAAPPNATPRFGGSHADLIRRPVSRGWGDSYAVRLVDSAGRPLVFAEVLLVAHMADGTRENVPMGALPEPGTYRGTVPAGRSTPVGLRIRVRAGDKFVEVPVRR